MSVKYKWKMCVRGTLLTFLFMFFLAEAGRPKKHGIKQFKNFNHIRRNTSSNFGLWPTSFNLATKALISANATCGENGREEFCRMVENGKGRCGICDNFGTDPGKKHPISYAIDGSNRWWQSPALLYGSKYEYVTIIIDLKQVYQVTDVIVKSANSLRPGAWVLERSLDGVDYEPWQYFARSDKECLERFGIPSTKGKPHYFTDTEVICTSFYSKLTPMENGEIHTSLINGRPGATETSPELLEFTKARYVRLRLMGLRGAVEPLPRWFLQDVLKEKRLFYTIRDISIIGYCVCNGHAENCRYNVASGHPECECAHHTCGANCDRCCPMYNQRQWGPGSSRDAHQCLPCNCHGHATSCHYDENVDKAGLSMDINGNYQGGGVCDNCTAHTAGVNCERCLPGYYRPHGTLIHADQPCAKCECDFPGSKGTCVQEGTFAGSCDCLLGYEGEKCERCAAGFKGWPRCEACPCDSRGTLTMTDCEGDCTCKTNVDGRFCDRCKSGHFNLSEKNPNGCTQCYCSGVTTLCEAASVSPKKVQTLENWLTTDVEISDVVKPIRDDKGLFSIGGYEFPQVESLYWLAPEAYLGNKLEYYGSFFTFKVHWVIMRGDTSGKPTLGPNIILVGANGLKIGHGNDSFTTSNTTFDIEMNENGWNLMSLDNRQVTRNEFLGVLSNVSHVLLRATFHTDQIESLLEEATLHSVGETELVEKCFCPSGYSGLSCESCAFGYVQITTNSTPIQTYCGKCDCNGHSETCNPDTGECFCLHDTIGDNCERCKPGFYGNPLIGTPEDCKKCACPLENDENNFSPSCQLDYLKQDGDGYVCTQCPKGYTGDHCEICDDGYFGNPMEFGNFCQPCNCNGGPCDKITGKCLSCKGNTEGWRCEKCKEGYYGNALMSNCISCQCDPVGATSKSCDLETGQCECKQRFTGRTCNKCELGYGNVTALCTKCECNLIGSKSDICDQQSGLCECKEGVDGFHCDTCQNLHYGLSESGCKGCNCDKYGSKIQACDQNTGKCFCKPHYEGAKCDRCEAGYWKSNSICKPCNCNYNGSTSPNCDAETGMCPCKPGVQGQRCDLCKDKHYGNVTIGCRACDPCEDEGHICHPENGKCVCPVLTRGRKCEECVENSWGHEPGIGCKACGCSLTGSSSQQCEAVSGRCTCKLGFEGEKCNKCSFGYYNYPYCQKCNCVVAGTRPEDCSHGTCKCSERGCACKTNVEGRKCDRCKAGTFGMDVDNPEGCSHCFCSHRSTTCTASDYIWDQIRTSSDVDEGFEEDCVNKRFCWKLSPKFSGDFMDSYGGYLRISTNSPRNYVYLTGNGFVLEALTDPRGDVRMTEIFWKLRKNSKTSRLPNECSHLLSRPCLMVVLQNVTQIQIEPEFPVLTLKLEEVLLDKLSNAKGISQAKSVEQCVCPHNYESSSCQDPKRGYYRYYPQPHENEYNYVDRILGVAKPCQCNNKSGVCDVQTGHCLNCTNFTTGRYCELCAEGYFRDLEGNCSPCQCPSETQNFAKNCTVTPRGFICVCKPGYQGSKCNECEDQYWGNPQRPGGSCQACNCNPHGSRNLRCNKQTGKCQCKPGFVGQRCSKCSSPREVIQDGVCVPCDECTQILFHAIDDLSDGIDNTLTLFKNGLGPPWSSLNSTIHTYKLLNEKFENIDKANEFVRNTDITQIEAKIEKISQKLKNEITLLNTQSHNVDNIQKESLNTSRVISELDKKLDGIINNINKFGTSHINVHEALREAEELLEDIINISKEAPSTQYYQDFFDKCQNVYENVNDIYGTDLNTTHIRTKLDALKKRILKFNLILDRTEQNNKLARNKNKQNEIRIEVLKRSINKIDERYSKINESIIRVLSKINATNDLLEDLTKIHEMLSRLSIVDASQNFDEGIFDDLSAVREHVRDLQNKIKTYKNLFDFTPEEWMKIDASGAYEKIVKSIELANNEAQKARNITLDALRKLYPSDDDSIPTKTSLARAFSDRILKRVTNLENLTGDVRKNTEELEDLKHAILFNGKNNNELNSVLRQIRKNITEQFKDLSELEQAKNNSRNASSLITSIEQGIKDINITMQYELKKTYHKYLDLLSNKEVADLKEKINKTRKYIDKINLTVFDKIEDANKNKFDRTAENIAELRRKIHRLQNEIQYANERVETIQYGVNITNCERRYSLKNDIFRSLEIHFKCNYSPLLKLFDYKNETMSLACRNGKIYVTWKNETQDIQANGTLSLTRRGSKIEIKAPNQESKYISYEDVFIVDSLQIGDLENSNETCIHKVILNEKTIGLWRFTTSKGSCLACHRNISDVELDSSWAFFNGNGYRKVLQTFIKSNLNPSRLNFVFDFATFDENSLIFLALDTTNKSSFVSLSLKDGYLYLNVRHINGREMTIVSDKKYNNGIEKTAEIAMFFENNNQFYTLTVRDLATQEEKKDTSITDLGKTNVYKIKKSEIFIGGVTSNVSSVPVNTTPFAGNLRVSLNSVPITNEKSLSYNVERRKTKLEYFQTWFSGKGFVNLEETASEISEITFVLKPVDVNNNFVMNINDLLDISLNNSSLRFKFRGKPELWFENICANSSNFISLKKDGTIKVNKEPKSVTDFETSLFDGVIRFYLGHHTSNGNPKFSGSISDIFLDDRPLLFDATTVKSFADVEIGRDKLESLSKKECMKEMQNTERYFIRPVYKTEPQAFKFGDKPHSFVLVKNLMIGKKFSLEFEFRTFYPNGLLFYAISNPLNRNTTFYTVLEIQGGDIRLRVQGHRTKTMNIVGKINDGAWHHVQVEQMVGKKKWRLVVKADRKWKVKERTVRNNFIGGVYFGGIPDGFGVHKKLKNELHPLRGCIRSLKINKNLQIVKNNNNVFYNNIGQCFQSVEEGAYFGGDAFAVYKYDFKVNNFLELSFDFKTSESNGILLSVSNLGNSPALSVELQNGAVVMTIDMGNGVISKVTNSPRSDSSLTNNEWHNITALYSSSELTVNVDGIRKSWVQSDINSMMNEIEAPLYIGGLPSNAPSGTLKIKENFTGCIRKFKIEDNIMDWTDMKELNNVQLNSCLA